VLYSDGLAKELTASVDRVTVEKHCSSAAARGMSVVDTDHSDRFHYRLWHIWSCVIVWCHGN